jgi:predicted metal-dependent RNase
VRWTGALHRFVGNSKSQLTFLGAADEVTGSYYLTEMPHLKFLVDCGMFQGDREADRKNRDAFSISLEPFEVVYLPLPSRCAGRH